MLTLYRTVSHKPHGGRTKKAFKKVRQKGVVRLPTEWIGKKVKVTIKQ